MIRVLHVIGAMGSGGAEAMLMNLYRVMDRSKIQFDFVVHTDKKAFYDEEIEALGGRIFHTEKYNVRNFYSYKKFWREFLAEHPEYQIVHGHINSSASIYLSEAKRQGRIAVVHSHNTKNNAITLRAIAFRIATRNLRNLGDYFFACSVQAGVDRFGTEIAESDRFSVLMNGIDLARYQFNVSTRERLRSEYGVTHKTVLGHVGRFSKQKNHAFLFEIFASYHKQNPSSELWLIGTGELEEQLKQSAKNLGIRECVRFIGTTKDVSDYLMAMDIFVFPSLYEGLGIALVEAEATGLMCVVSEAIQPEAIFSENVKKLALAEGALSWSEAITDVLSQSKGDRTAGYAYAKEAGFDISDSAAQLQRFYTKIEEERAFKE